MTTTHHAAPKHGLDAATVSYVRSVHIAGGRRLPATGSDARRIADSAVAAGYLRRAGLVVYCTAQGDHL